MIKVIYGDTEDRNIEEFHQRRKDRNNKLLFSKIYTLENLEWMEPYSIEIETVNRCNNDCSFCPVNRNSDTRKHITMTSELFYSIIRQCREMEYSGYLSLFSNNEPLLDRRICEFTDHARKELPKARLALFTNGILLTEEIFLYLVERLDYLIIDNYNDEMQPIPSVQKILEKYLDLETKCDIKIYIRKKTQVLSSRGGDAPNRVREVAYESGCMMPFMQVVIRPDGKISKCCQDGLGLSTIGDLQKESLAESWRNSRRKKLCMGMITKGRQSRKDCLYCDVFGHDNYMPKGWKPLIISSFLDIVSDNYMKNKRIVLVGGSHYCSRMRRFLLSAGISTILQQSSEDVQILQDDFYVLENFDSVFLKELDPFAEYAGKKWIVPEQILSYMIYDYSEHAEKFGRILGSLLHGYQVPLYFVGEPEAYRFLIKNVNVMHITRVDPGYIRKQPESLNKQGVFLMDHTVAEEREFLLKELGISSVQILDYDFLLNFAKEG